MSAEIIDFGAKRDRLKAGFEPISHLLAGDECFVSVFDKPFDPSIDYLRAFIKDPA